MLDETKFKKIQEIIIPEYIYQVQMSAKRNIKYFNIKGGRGKIKRENLEDMPKKYKNLSLDLEGFWLEKGQRIIGNPIAAGTPKFIPINGQLFYSQSGGKFTRAKVVRELHEWYTEILKDYAPLYKEEYPIVIILNWFCPYSHKTMDSTNMFFAYHKTFEDVLTNLGIIVDDEVRYVTGGFPIYTPCDTFEERKLVFSFYKDMRAEIQQLKLL